eukprot:m.40317 g.40317  ORF g.40317 m.40317 type:complete len:81 (-) comp6917_c0_seq2:866-1108(-)
MLRFLRGVGGSHTLIKSSTSSATSSTCSSTASSVSLLQGYVEDSAKTITSLSTFLRIVVSCYPLSLYVISISCFLPMILS